MPSFTLTIELGNAAMESPADVGEALERLGSRLAVRQWLAAREAWQAGFAVRP